MKRRRCALIASGLLLAWSSVTAQTTDTTIIFAPANQDLLHATAYSPLANAWGIDLLISNNGFGMGAFFRREFSDVLSSMISFSLSDIKDDAEVERYDYYGSSYIFGKKNRLLHIPLHLSVQYRLFHDDIMDSFRPYVTAAIGPSMLFVSPYNRFTSITVNGSEIQQEEQVDFFESLKYGKAHYTIGGYVGFGAMFGIDKVTLTGVSLRYYFIPFPHGIEIMDFGAPVKEFGGFYITIHFGSFY